MENKDDSIGINEVSPIIVENFESLNKEVKKAFLTNITKAYIIRGSDNFKISQDNYLKDLKLEELRFIPDKGFLGGTVARRLTINFNNVDNQFNIQDEDLQLFIGVEYNNTDYYVKMGNFIVQKPETENTTDNTSFEALDYMCKFNQTYVDEMQYPCKLVELAENVCKQAGVELGNKDFKNADFIVTDNQFVSGEPLRTVIGAIALSAFSWARIKQDNKLYIDFQKKEIPEEEIDYNSFFTLNFASKEYGPINRIVLRNSQIEGENVTVEDNESITNNGIHELVIADNPFAYTQEKRMQLIEAGRELFGLRYMPVNSVNTVGYVYLDSNSFISLKDMQEKVVNTYVFNHTIDYDGTILDEIASPALTETETKYTYTPEEAQKIKRTEAIVNKYEQTINFIIEEQTELGSKQNVLEQTLESTTNTIKEVNDDLTEKINQLQVNLDGVTQTLTQSGGNNIFVYSKEFWTGLT